jgi:Major Facilitator Superfamily
MLLLGLDFGGQIFPWSSTKVLCLLIFGTLTIGIFIFSEKKLAKYPLMPLALFKDRNNVATLLVTFAHGIVFIGGEYYLPLYLQSTHGFSPFKSGIMILPITVMEAVMGIFCAVLTHSWGCYRELIWAGCVLMTVGTGLYIALGATTSVAVIVGFELVGGAGCGLLFQPVLIALQAFVRQDNVATAMATLGFVRNMAVRTKSSPFYTPR